MDVLLNINTVIQKDHFYNVHSAGKWCVFTQSLPTREPVLHILVSITQNKNRNLLQLWLLVLSLLSSVMVRVGQVCLSSCGARPQLNVGVI